tara:strand:+ start:2455 stop:2823 length:369 start_codon:yes stop_codon:yes gene_type:complete
MNINEKKESWKPEAIKLCEKYENLVSYARKEKNNPIEKYGEDVGSRIAKWCEDIESEFPEETKNLNEEGISDFAHGFNSGCLAAFRFCLDSSEIEIDFSDFGEEGKICAIEDAKMNFPDCNT